MESGPPLNLSTSVKVEDSGIEGSLSVKGEFIQRSNGDQSFVLLQPLSDNENEVLTITGEAVNDSSLTVKNDKEVENNCSTQHEKSKSYKCSHCAEEFFRATQLRIHEKSHIEEKVHECEQCLETFPRLSLLIRHRQEHTKKAYECPECDIPLNTYNGFRMHMKKHKGERRFKCTECAMSFVQQSHLVTHRRKHTGEKPYECDICNTRFKQVSHLTTHLRTHTNDRPYVCDTCDAAFSQTGSLKRHKRSHTGEKPFHCIQCNAVFVEKRNLTRHMLSHSGIRPFKCNLCSASFTQLIDLKRHNVSHSGIKPYKCDICEAAFSRKNNLKWHKFTHEGDTPHKCEICNVGFRIARDLKNHKRSHADYKPYSCDHCKASFAQITTLKRHVIVHSGNKQFCCGKCEATFFDKSSLKRHILRHEAIKPYSCDRCLTSFLEARALKRHNIVVHNEGKYEDIEVNGKADAKQSCSKDMSPALEEENSLHIYEPSYQKTTHIPETTPMLMPRTVQDILREPAEESTQAVCQVIMTEASSDNNSQLPTLVLTQPGHPPKTARPAVNCQNHHSHIHTLLEGGYGQWQTWCFCETPNVLDENDPLTLPTSSESHSMDLHTNVQTVVAQQQNLDYQTISVQRQDISQSIPVSNQSLPNHLSQSPDPHHHLQPSNQNQSKSHSLTEHANVGPVFHSMNNVQSEFQSTNSYVQSTNSYSQSTNSQYNDQVNSFGNESQQPVTSSDSNQHQEQEELQNSQNISIHLDKPNYIHIPNDEVVTSSYQFTPNNKRDCNIFEKEENEIHVAMNVADKTHSQHNELLTQTQDNEFSQQEIIISEGIAKPHEKLDNEGLSIKQNGQNYRKSHVPIQTQHDYEDVSSSKHDQFSIDQKTSKESNYQLHHSTTFKGKSRSKTQNTQSKFQILPHVDHNMTEPLNQKNQNITYQVYEELPPVENCNKDEVTLQYSLTVNNPATGEIQIQSDVFPAKSTAAPKPPIKKRRIAKSSVGNEERNIICTYCSKSYLKQSQLEMHLRTHTGEKPFICGICNQCFAHNNSLTIHMRSHTGERPYTCVYCGATFTQKSNLRVHHRTHTGEKPFKCDICESSFSQGSHLTAHKRIHNNDRPFVCTTCSQAFTQKSALKRHEMKHSGLKPHLCNICDAKFAQKEDLRRHHVIHGIQKSKTKSNSKDKKTSSTESSKVVLKSGLTRTSKSVTASDINGPETGCKKPLNEKDESNKHAKSEQRVDSIKTTSKRIIKEEYLEEELKGSDADASKMLAKSLKSKIRTNAVEPVRTSKRIKEAAERKKFKAEDSDFITGDLDEIDRAEEMEDQFVKVTRLGGWRKKDNVKESEVVQSWCFCEVPHGPDEPHTHIDNSKTEQYSEEQSDSQIPLGVAPSNVIINNENCREGVLHFALPQLSHAVVLQGEQVTLQNHQNQLVGSSHLSMTSGMQEPHIISSNGTLLSHADANSMGNHFISTNEQLASNQNVHNQVISDDGKNVFSTTQIISSHVLPGGQFITPEGTFFIEAGDLLNNGAVVLNSSPGTFFFDIADTQLLNVPVGGNMVNESVVVGTSSSLNESEAEETNENVYTTTTQPITSSNTISFSVTDSQSSSLLENSTPHTTTVISSDLTSQNMLSTDPSGIVTQQAGSSSSPNTVQYTSIDGNDIGLFNHDVELESPDNNPIEAEHSKIVITENKPSQPIVVNPSKCSVCGKAFAQKCTLKLHMPEAHPGLFFCSICYDAFTTREHLTTHMLQHQTTHTCPECFLIFPSKNTLNQHRQKLHKVGGLSAAKKEERTFACIHCDASFYQLSDLKRHLLSHTGEKPFRCRQCGAYFTRKSSLKKHERIHTGEKPYNCKECDQSFAYMYQFNRHKATHKEEDQTNYSIPVHKSDEPKTYSVPNHNKNDDQKNYSMPFNYIVYLSIVNYIII